MDSIKAAEEMLDRYRRAGRAEAVAGLSNSLSTMIALAKAQEAELADHQDMAAVGDSLMASIDAYQSHPFMIDWSPAEDPAELVGDLLNELDEKDAELARLKVPLGDEGKALMGKLRKIDFSPDDMGHGDIGTASYRNPDGPAAAAYIERLSAQLAVAGERVSMLERLGGDVVTAFADMNTVPPVALMSPVPAAVMNSADFKRGGALTVVAYAALSELESALATLPSSDKVAACQHDGWSFSDHGRVCPRCGMFMVDMGD